jgi:hypothetical protein
MAGFCGCPCAQFLHDCACCVQAICAGPGEAVGFEREFVNPSHEEGLFEVTSSSPAELCLACDGQEWQALLVASSHAGEALRDAAWCAQGEHAALERGMGWNFQFALACKRGARSRRRLACHWEGIAWGQ